MAVCNGCCLAAHGRQRQPVLVRADDEGRVHPRPQMGLVADVRGRHRQDLHATARQVVRAALVLLACGRSGMVHATLVLEAHAVQGPIPVDPIGADPPLRLWRRIDPCKRTSDEALSSLSGRNA